MTLLADHEIEALCQGDRPMIAPFTAKTVEKGVLSYGVSSYGYDVRLGTTLQVMVDRHQFDYRTDLDIRTPFLDPKEPLSSQQRFRTITALEGQPFFLEPHSFALGYTLETFDVPRNVMISCMGKSTYARIGLNVIVTPIEPEFKGQVVIELINPTDHVMKVYAGEGIAQFLFHKAQTVCRQSYKDKGGKYQDQEGITHARIKGHE